MEVFFGYKIVGLYPYWAKCLAATRPIWNYESKYSINLPSPPLFPLMMIRRVSCWYLPGPQTIKIDGYFSFGKHLYTTLDTESPANELMAIVIKVAN